MEVTKVIDPDYVPATNNPYKETLDIGQFIAWPLTDIVEDSDCATPHGKVRKVAKDNYLNNARRAQKQYNKNNKVKSDYVVGDTVGIRIHQADRTNTDPKILPCKVLDKDPTKSAQYQIYCASGIIKGRCLASDLVNLEHVHVPALHDVNPETLPETSMINACRTNTRWKTTATESVCFCKGSCITNKCRCKKAGLKCSTKCHPSDHTVCQNRF